MYNELENPAASTINKNPQQTISPTTCTQSQKWSQADRVINKGKHTEEDMS